MTSGGDPRGRDSFLHTYGLGIALLVAFGIGVVALPVLNADIAGPGPTVPPLSGSASVAPTGLASLGASADPATSGASAAPSAVPSSAASSGDGLRAVVDASLIAILPKTVGGFPLSEFPEAENQAVADPDLGRNVSRVATAFVGDAAGANWAYSAIVDVRPEAQSVAFYRDWQESFDASACEQAGGVTGHTTVIIAGHDVERTACGAGVRTYHVKIKGSGLLLSISGLGAADLAELEIAALAP